ncbi:MAG: hypothetical protein VB055_09310 [Oscillospiraceae bacterium]|nr:hypothetical protein [Oscillospiraceae bacterium]
MKKTLKLLLILLAALAAFALITLLLGLFANRMLDSVAGSEALCGSVRKGLASLAAAAGGITLLSHGGL